MAHIALRQLIGAALVDRELSDGLMNGKGSTLMTEFDLTDEERRLVSSFETDSVWELASSIHSWLVSEVPPSSAHVDYASIQA